MKTKKCRFGYLIPVKICGKTFRFLIDTGAQRSMIKVSVVESLKLTLQSAKVIVQNSCNQRRVLTQTCNVELSIDSVPIGIIDMLVMSTNLVFCNRQCQGILGTDVLYKLDFELSISKKDFTVLGMKKEASKEFFQLSINGVQTCNAMIDTASSSSWISEDSVLGFSNDCITRPVLIVSFDGVYMKHRKIYKRVKVKTGNFRTECHNVYVGRNVVRNGCLIDFVLGLDVLKDVTLTYRDEFILCSEKKL